MLRTGRFRNMMKIMFLCSLILLIVFGCTNTSDTSLEKLDVEKVRTPSPPHLSMPLIERNGKSYFDMGQAVFRLQYNTKWNTGHTQFLFGDHDVVYEVTPGKDTALRKEEVVQLSDAPILLENRLYITPESWSDLFQSEVEFHLQDDLMVIHGLLDPWWDQEAEQRKLQQHVDFGDAGFQALASNDAQKVISKARQYLGVPYEFGADPYASSDRFDCSSFIQHVYKTVGVTMPRVARNQAQKGSSVSRSNLKPGDLMFFYVPGRFRAEKTVGHVAIYMGNNKMIHSSPEPENGVQITDIDRDHWKRTYLHARRVL